MKRWWLLFAEVLLVIVMFCFGGILGIATCPEVCRECPKNVVRNYVGEEYYVRTNESWLTMMRVYQQILFEWWKYFYLTNDNMSIGLPEDEFMKLVGEQNTLLHEKK